MNADTCLADSCREPPCTACCSCGRPMCREHRIEAARVCVDGLWLARDRCTECEVVVREFAGRGEVRA